ncbi:MAG: deoxyuridine 5'-triphosphate nucleotidohydrolase [Elusimicrobia bacterium RIFOXYA2_FULL_58_8]|nr:MAG: deoxyuridine 5'-triphosphate nucleotidohydrolase [Elusimicrobia bacterium RIFOXYA12_FULL_57_11]OGS16919.1 MAG: deoxyuridine 5'-triphosphate nucleotidohydrolase [Elusimicrobia bacterium RIFOXYA2_FULL_58_8]
MEKIEVVIQKLAADAVIPKYAHEGDAGVDLYSAGTFTLLPGQRLLVPTGIKMAIPYGYEGQVRPKSGLALKHGLSVLNTPGTVDAPYRGEVGVIVINHDPKAAYEIKKGEKIAQMVFNKVEYVTFKEAAELPETTRGAGGFGSTGKH